MSELLLCRVCLATNVKLYDMFKHRLAAPYENLTGFKVPSPGPNSYKVCAPCSVFILKWFSFKQLCQNSQELLQFACSQNHEVTTEYIQSLGLKTEPLCKLVVVRNVNKYEVVVHEEFEDIKEEMPVCNDQAWDSSEDEAKPLVEDNVKVEDDENIQEDPQLLDNEEVDLFMLTKEQQIEELQARKLSMNYLRSFYKCPLCYKGFMTDGTYRNHMIRHDPSNGPRKCEICHTHWPSISSLNSHISTSHERKYVCRLCSHVSKSRHRAKEHFKWHTGHLFVCKICGATFEKSTSHLTHLRLQHPSEHSCDLCGESFVSGNGLKMHKKKAHRYSENEGSKTECVCETCGTNFKSLEALEKHAEGGHCQNTRACTHCGESFETESSLKEHIKIHNKDEPVKCDECSRTFVNERAYALHYQRVHLGVKLRCKSTGNKMVVVCEVCGKKCLTNAALIYHQRIHTGEKPFQCTLCPKRFSVHQRLQIHLRTHTGETPYKCSLCPKAFKHKAALNRHDRVHTGEKPYACSHCGKCFSQSNSMKIHVKTVHLKMPAPYRSNKQREEV